MQPGIKLNLITSNRGVYILRPNTVISKMTRNTIIAYQTTFLISVLTVTKRLCFVSFSMTLVTNTEIRKLCQKE